MTIGRIRETGRSMLGSGVASAKEPFRWRPRVFRRRSCNVTLAPPFMPLKWSWWTGTSIPVTMISHEVPKLRLRDLVTIFRRVMMHEPSKLALDLRDVGEEAERITTWVMIIRMLYVLG